MPPASTPLASNHALPTSDFLALRTQLLFPSAHSWHD
ncbi:Uncharacterised protein [Vibrio cholerae]|nr:Uncharacterised protein [Vibrio cholerae]CSI37462.1 Uncharacterised protein [Vibrio cholerae]